MITVRPSTTTIDGHQLVWLAQTVGSEALTGNLSDVHGGQLADGYISRRAIAETTDERICGYSSIARAPWRPPGWFELQIIVDPTVRRQGIGTALFDEALRYLRDQQANMVQSQISDSDAAALTFAQGCGFAISQHYFTMVLDVAIFDPQRYHATLEHVQAAGFELFTFADVADQPDARRKLYELNKRLAPDLPGNDDSFPSFDDYLHEIIEADWFRPEGQFIAAKGSQWVGLVGMGFDDAASTMSHEFTAVDRRYRGQGLAQALKLRSILLAQTLGLQRVITGNDATNTAVLAVNRKLGYVQQPGIYKLHRLLER